MRLCLGNINCGKVENKPPVGFRWCTSPLCWSRLHPQAAQTHLDQELLDTLLVIWIQNKSLLLAANPAVVDSVSLDGHMGMAGSGVCREIKIWLFLEGHFLCPHSWRSWFSYPLHSQWSQLSPSWLQHGHTQTGIKTAAVMGTGWGHLCCRDPGEAHTLGYLLAMAGQALSCQESRNGSWLGT